MDVDTGALLYAKNADAHLPMASTTKITTAILAIQHGGLLHRALVSRRAATIGQSTMSLRKGERLRVIDLLYGLLLNSANDAAITLAEHTAGSVSAFVARMNALARSLHMTETHYITPHGLDRTRHYSSARDLATIARYAMRNPLFRRIVSTRSYHIAATHRNQEHWLANINYPLYWMPGVDGVKPGDTDAAGLCQVIDAHRNGHHLLAVVLNTPNLVTDVKMLLDYGSRDFTWVHAPAWWDTPSETFSGGAGASSWRYYVAAGHELRGAFLAYFNSHGGLNTLGYPRTDELTLDGTSVQYFQNAELVRDRLTGHVVAADLGTVLLASLAAPTTSAPHSYVAPRLLKTYTRWGGGAVLGATLTPVRRYGAMTVQFFARAAIAQTPAGPHLLPLGDLALQTRGLLPAHGVFNVYPTTILPAHAVHLTHVTAR
jgi:hypothetical protein